MDALTILEELTRHMEWADSLVFLAIRGNPGAEQDEVLLGRLRHIHLVQKVFLDVWGNQPISPQETEALSASELLGFAKSVHGKIQQFQGSLSAGDLDKKTPLPWARQVSAQLGFEMADPSLGQTMLQVSAHSSYHRGQVNARLRDLGLVPPLTDYIAWVWSGRPSPTWPARPA
ncbi:MAG: damage-inducible protein DinB [Acidobacteria bacterium]|nr:damage-inducible protein DinB [Acidobacteriota bacterium]